MGYHRATFGIGSATAIPSGSNPTPTDFALVTGATVEFKSTDVPLKGQKLMPVDSGTSDLSISGKVSLKDISAAAISLVLPGVAPTTGSRKMTTHAAAIPTTPFQLTVTQSATFSTDLGVVNLTTGKAMKRVASSPATGEYSVALGVYTFASADAGNSVVIRYSYTTTSGTTYTATNQDAGSTSMFSLELWAPDASTLAKGIGGMRIPAVKFPNLSAALKANDWSDVSVDFNAYESSSGVYWVGYEA